MLQFEVVASGPARRLALGWTVHDLTATTGNGDYAGSGGTVSLEPEAARLVDHWGADRFTIPAGVALASNGEILAVDGPTSQVLRFSTSGVFLGKFGTAACQVRFPTGIAVSEVGDVYVLNSDGRILRFAANGQCLGTWGAAEYDQPTDIAVVGDGFVYVCDAIQNVVKRYWNGGIVGTWSTQITGEPPLDGPASVAVDGAGNVYVSKGATGRILKYGPSGELLATWTDTKGLCIGHDMHFDAAGNLLIADGLAGRVVVLDPQGTFLTEWTLDEGPQRYPGEFSATCVVSDHDGNVYVGSRHSASIAHYRWDRAVGSIAVPVNGDAVAEADETFELNLAPNPNVTLLDGVGVGTIVNDDVQAGTNLVPNGQFETALDGWSSYSGAVLTLVSGGHSGAKSANALGTSALVFGLNDIPNLVISPPLGARYRYSAWVRSASAGSGWLRVREYLGSALQATTASEKVPFDGSWHLVEVTVRARTAGSSLDFQVVGEFGATGQQFQVDDVAVQPLGPDVLPVVSAVRDVSGSWSGDIVVEVSAYDPEAEPLDALETDLSGFPGATFTVTPDRKHGTLRWRPRFEDVRDEPHLVTFTARNGGLASMSTRITVRPDLVLNPSFEVIESGWAGHLGATLARVAGGRRSGYAGRLTLPSLDWAGINDSPNWAAPAGYSRRYVFGAWVRSNALVGVARMQVREYDGVTLLGTGTAIGGPLYSGALSPEWRRIVLAYTCVSTGASELDLSIDTQGAVGETFDVDDVSIIAMAPSSNVGVEDALPLALAARVFPNPARGNLMLELALPASGRLRVELYDIAGRRRAVVADEAHAAAGMRRFALRATEGALSPGIYWYRASIAGEIRQGRFVVTE